MRPRRGGLQSFALSCLGIALGIGFTLVVHVLLWFFTVPGQTFSGAWDRTLATSWTGFPSAFLMAAGALAGFLILGSLAGNRFSLILSRGAFRTLGLLVGVAAGCFAATAAYVAFWIAGNPSEPFSVALGHLRVAADASGDPFVVFLVAGGVAGLAIAAHALGGQPIRWFTRAAVGAVVGSMTGLVVYSVGFVILNHPGIPRSPQYILHFAEAIYDLGPAEFILVAFGAAVGVLLSKYSWRLYGILTLVSLLCVVVGYLLYTVTVTLPLVRPEERGLSYVLFAAETITLSLALLYSFYTIDVATRKHWRRTPLDARVSKYYMPKVAVQVPVYNEPPEVVLETLKRLLALDYPIELTHITVIDDSTRPECADPVREFCRGEAAGSRIEYLHRDDRTGYKAGALNYALQRTPPDVELIAVVDADYQVEPEFLRETVGFFIDTRLGWVQTPQDYRNRDESFLTRQYYVADAYFYRTVLPSRNEENSIIFCGTMGILRKQALVEVGGWGEEYITEDAELSLRLIESGWKSMYVNKTYGRGLIPSTFDAYKKQHYRWAAGGGKILRGHFFDVLLGRLTARQRFDYFVGLINWIEGGFILVIALAVLLMGLGELFGFPVVLHHANEILLLGLVPWFLLLEGLTRVHMVLRRSTDLSFAGTLRVLGMWFSVKFSNLFGALKAILGFHTPFMRTRKVTVGQLGRMGAVRQALRLTVFESTLAVLMLGTGLGVAVKMFLEGGGAAFTLVRSLLALWLLYYTLVFAAAPLYAYLSYRTFKPDSTPSAGGAPARPEPSLARRMGRRLEQPISTGLRPL